MCGTNHDTYCIDKDFEHNKTIMLSVIICLTCTNILFSCYWYQLVNIMNIFRTCTSVHQQQRSANHPPHISDGSLAQVAVQEEDCPWLVARLPSSPAKQTVDIYEGGEFQD